MKKNIYTLHVDNVDGEDCCSYFRAHSQVLSIYCTEHHEMLRRRKSSRIVLSFRSLKLERCEVNSFCSDQSLKMIVYCRNHVDDITVLLDHDDLRKDKDWIKYKRIAWWTEQTWRMQYNHFQHIVWHKP